MMRFPMPLREFRNIFAILMLCSGIGATALNAEGRLSLPEYPLDPIVFRDSEIFKAGGGPAEVFQIFVGEREKCCDGRTPMAGTYSAVVGGWSFSPHFELIEGQPYVARIASRDGVDLTEFELVRSEQGRTLPIVTAVYPSGPEIPENTLRFYIHFSEPMKPHVAEKYIKLVDAAGDVDDAAFMQFKQELWSANRRRLTVLLDPGRIKRGVSQNLSLGPALEQGRSYSIVVGAGWPAAGSGKEMEDFERSFRVSAPLRTVPDSSAWQILAPKVGSLDPIQIELDRPYDRAQLHSEIRVHSQEGEELSGLVHVTEGETSWIFTPDRPWDNPTVTLVVNPFLEDAAGNNFRELLDHVVGTEEVEVEQLDIIVKLVERGSGN